MSKKKQSEEKVINVKGKQIKVSRIYETAYYLRKLLIFLLCLMIVVGVILFSVGVITNTLTSEIYSVGFLTLVSIVSLIYVIKNKRLLELSNNHKKKGGNK